LGHYFATLRNRVRLQDGGSEVFVLVADYQVLTDRDTAEHLEDYVTGIVLDYLAIGIDPDRSVIFAHSAVPALNQLILPFLSLVSVQELRRNPTVKDEITHSRQASVSGLMFTYPVHQAADILFCKANLVPVGQDQLPHVELTRLIREAKTDADRHISYDPPAGRRCRRSGHGGGQRAVRGHPRAIAAATLAEVRDAMRMSY
jgi:tryptophanyl-tRNA synthetase